MFAMNTTPIIVSGKPRLYYVDEKVCPNCGKSFTAVRLRKYCGKRCKRQAAWKRNGLASVNRKRGNIDRLTGACNDL